MSVKETVHCDQCAKLIGDRYEMSTQNNSVIAYTDGVHGGVYFGDHSVAVFWTPDNVWCSTPCFFKWVDKAIKVAEQTKAIEESKPTSWFSIEYNHCGTTWYDEWDSIVDNECPVCGKDISYTKAVDLTV